MLVVGILFLAVGAMALVGFFLQRHRAGRLGNTPVVSTADAAFRGESVAGEKSVISVQGAIACGDPLESPVTKTPCLFFHTKVTAEWKSGNSTASRVISEQSHAADIVVDDGSGPVAVTLSNLDVGDFKQIFSKTNKMGLLNVMGGTKLNFGDAGFTVIAGLPDQDGHSVPDHAEYKVVEWALPVLDQAFVMGKAEGGKIVAPKWVSLVVSSRSRDELLAKTATMMKRTKIASAVATPIGAVATIVAVVLGGSARLEKADAHFDLSSAQPNVVATLTAPAGGELTYDANMESVRLTYGQFGTKRYGGELSVFPRAFSKLGCPERDKKCKVIEGTETTILYSTKGRDETLHMGVVHVQFGNGAKGQCDVEAPILDDARRLLAACQSISGEGYKRGGELASSLAAAEPELPAKKTAAAAVSRRATPKPGAKKKR